jgi:ribonuclease P protein component
LPLRTVKEFNKLYNSSKKYHTKYFVLFLQKDGQKRFSVVASKKIGNAVKRAYAKRRLRALFIKKADSLEDSLVLVAKKDILDVEFSKLEYLFTKALKALS